MKSRFWYHCSETSHGQYLEVCRKWPRMMADNEPKTPRLCVGPTIASCFAARLFTSGTIYVYKTPIKIKAIKPKTVWDKILTNEHWLIPPKRLELYTIISKHIIEEIQLDVKLMYSYKRKRSNHRSRISQYLRAARILEENGFTITTWEKRFLRNCAEVFQVNENYILEKHYGS